MADGINNDDELRQCPSCRMKVSVWATKCHHCGEELGRPRREEAKLTLKDLGGTQQTTYKPSGNVTGALESFRAEEVASEASRSRPKPPSLLARLFGQVPPPPPPARSPIEEQTALDQYSKNLAASLLDDGETERLASRQREQLAPAPGAQMVVGVVKVALVLLLIVALYFGASFGWTFGKAWIEERNRPPEISYNNKAPQMLARGESPVDVYEEAIKAVGIVDNEENRKIADDVRALLMTEIDELMASNPWRSANHDKAYRYIQRAVNVDNRPSVIAKFEEVNQVVSAYKFVLKSVDDSETTATFRLNHPKFEPEATVQVADRLMDRFIIQRISRRGVDLVDEKADGRKLTIAVNEGVKSRY